MKQITEINFVDTLGGKTPACVNRSTGQMYIDRKWWNTLPVEHRLFILLHEYAHANLQTIDEFKADELAFKLYADMGYSLTEAVHSLTRVLHYGNSEHTARTLALIKQAKEYDLNVNGNKKINMNDFSAFSNPLKGKGKNLFNKAKDTVNDAKDSIKANIKDAGESIKAETQKAKENIKATGGKIVSKLDKGQAVHFANKFNPVFLTARGAFRSVLALNIVGLTTILHSVKIGSQKRYDEILQKWYMLGGEKGELDKLIEENKNKPERFANLLKNKGFDGEYSNLTGNSANKVLAVAGALTSITALLATNPATAPVSVYTGSSAVVLGAFVPILKGFAKDKGATESQLNEVKEPRYDANGLPIVDDNGAISTDSDFSYFKTTQGKLVTSIVLALIILTIVLIILKKKNKL